MLAGARSTQVNSIHVIPQSRLTWIYAATNYPLAVSRMSEWDAERTRSSPGHIRTKQRRDAFCEGTALD